MSRKMSRLLVVDADVARSAGQTNHPTSMASREFLQAVRGICHRLAFGRQLAAEWKIHCSRYTFVWLASMQSKGKIVELASSDVPDLRGAVEDLNISEKDRDTILKDVHLVEAALAADRAIVSRDDVARSLLRRIAGVMPPLRSIVWVNPTNDAEDGVGWVQAGARLDKKRRLVS
jgi:hypothetical protein